MTGFGAHLVLFHGRDAELVAGVADFLAEGLAAGEGAVVVATAAHADAIGRAHRADGFDRTPLVDRWNRALRSHPVANEPEAWRRFDDDGLHLIRALSSAWGVERFAGGKSVWVELAAPAA